MISERGSQRAHVRAQSKYVVEEITRGQIDDGQLIDHYEISGSGVSPRPDLCIEDVVGKERSHYEISGPAVSPDEQVLSRLALVRRATGATLCDATG